MRFDRWQRVAAAVALVTAAAFAVHGSIEHYGYIAAPAVTRPRGDLRVQHGIRQLGVSYARTVGSITEVRLSGTPEQIGDAHARLLRSEMGDTERVVWQLFDRYIPNIVAQTVLLDLAQWRYRNVATGFSDERRREIAASALAFAPDPFADRFDTFQRFVYLNALYDISLAFEHSPLIGCTTFTFTGAAAANGEPLLARAFDFDVHDIFDQKKVVFLVRENGAIPFASVAWAGLVGVVSGMNAEGVAVVVHGARAGEPKTIGEPVTHALRRVLSRARTTEEAIAELRRGEAMVSHIVIVTDASGHAAAVERVPGATPFVRPLDGARVVSNHLVGPFENDPKNQRVRATTTTLDRENRGLELLRALTEPVDAAKAVSLLRDRKGTQGKTLPLGDRRAIDAIIATHGVVMNTAAKILWVSEAPHLLGRFVAFDLRRLLAADFDVAADTTPRLAIDADPLKVTRR